MQPLSTLQKEGGQKALKHPKDKLLKANAEYIYGENVVYLSLALSWLAKANLAAFSCSLANLFSYLDTFLRVGLINLPFKIEPLVKVLLDNLLELIIRGVFNVFLDSAPNTCSGTSWSPKPCQIPGWQLDTTALA